MSQAARYTLEYLEQHAHATVTASALHGGTFTLPLKLFLASATDQDRSTVPSLSFLLAHEEDQQSSNSNNTTTTTTSSSDGGDDGGVEEPELENDKEKETKEKKKKKTNLLLFDLGLRRETDGYIAPIRAHLTTRLPLDTSLDVRQSLLQGGVHPQDIADVIVSHVHWDHTGTPADYPQARFWVGHGALGVLAHGLGDHVVGHQHFESELFSGLHVEEFPPPLASPPTVGNGNGNGNGNEDGAQQGGSGRAGQGKEQGKEEGQQGWKQVGEFLLYDYYRDGSVYVVDAPGHLPGHVNLLARLAPRRWIYLVGDACHDRRLLTGADGIAEWQDAEGRVCCIHTDRAQAEATLARIRDLQQAAEGEGEGEGEGGQGSFSLEVILAHAMDWATANPGAFLPGRIAASI